MSAGDIVNARELGEKDISVAQVEHKRGDSESLIGTGTNLKEPSLCGADLKLEASLADAGTLNGRF